MKPAWRPRSPVGRDTTGAAPWTCRSSSRRSIAATRSRRPRSPRRRSASRRHRPSECAPGWRDGEQLLAQPGTLRSDQDRDAFRRHDVVDRRRPTGRGSSPAAASRSSDRELVGEAGRPGVGEREGGAHRHAQRSSGERVGARVIEDQSVEAERRGVADHRADVGRVVDRLEHDQAGRLRRRVRRRSDGVAARTGPRSGADSRARSRAGGSRCRRRRRGTGRLAARAGTCSVSTSAAHGHAPRRERSLDHQVALGEEEPGTGVVPLLGPAGQPALVQPELSEQWIVRILDRNESRLRRAFSLPSARIATQTWNDGIRGGPSVVVRVGRPVGVALLEEAVAALLRLRRCRRRGGSPRRRRPAGRRGRRR